LLFPLYYFAALIIARELITIYLPQLREHLGFAPATFPAPFAKVPMLISATLFASCIAAEFTRLRRIIPTPAIPILAFAAAELLIITRPHATRNSPRLTAALTE
jgi:hypothetical protein